MFIERDESLFKALLESALFNDLTLFEDLFFVFERILLNFF